MFGFHVSFFHMFMLNVRLDVLCSVTGSGGGGVGRRAFVLPLSFEILYLRQIESSNPVCVVVFDCLFLGEVVA